MGAVYRHVRFTLLPRLATRDELAGFHGPTLVLAARQDVFFPAKTVVDRAKHIIPSVTLQCLDGGHVPSHDGVRDIVDRIREFLHQAR